MTDYIKREDIVNLAVTMQTHLWTREQTYNAIFCLPSADVAPVVRCKDCVKCDAEYTNQLKEILGLYGLCKSTETMVYSDDYCSYGERKDSE